MFDTLNIARYHRGKYTKNIVVETCPKTDFNSWLCEGYQNVDQSSVSNIIKEFSLTMSSVKNRAKSLPLNTIVITLFKDMLYEQASSAVERYHGVVICSCLVSCKLLGIITLYPVASLVCLYVATVCTGII